VNFLALRALVYELMERGRARRVAGAGGSSSSRGGMRYLHEESSAGRKDRALLRSTTSMHVKKDEYAVDNDGGTSSHIAFTLLIMSDFVVPILYCTALF
jgi:hypothetical protein